MSRLIPILLLLLLCACAKERPLTTATVTTQARSEKDPLLGLPALKAPANASSRCAVLGARWECR